MDRHLLQTFGKRGVRTSFDIALQCIGNHRCRTIATDFTGHCTRIGNETTTLFVANIKKMESIILELQLTIQKLQLDIIK